MVFHSNRLEKSVTVSDSECYKYIRESGLGKSDFIVCTIDLNGNKLTKKVSENEFAALMCRSVEYK
jgi:hypothetical protein